MKFTHLQCLYTRRYVVYIKASKRYTVSQMLRRSAVCCSYTIILDRLMWNILFKQYCSTAHCIHTILHITWTEVYLIVNMLYLFSVHTLNFYRSTVSSNRLSKLCSSWMQKMLQILNTKQPFTRQNFRCSRITLPKIKNSFKETYTENESPLDRIQQYNERSLQSWLEWKQTGSPSSTGMEWRQTRAPLNRIISESIV